MHERFDDVENLIEERDGVQHVNGFQLGRQALLQVVEEFSNGADFDPQKMRQTHVVHVEQADQARAGTLMVHTGFYEHEVGFYCFVEVVVGRLRVAQSVEDHGMTGRCRW